MIYLLADIGGTNTRCAIARDGGRPERISTFRNAGFGGAGELLSKYIDSLDPDDRPASAALAVAGPVRDRFVQMLNIDWAVSASDLERDLQLTDVALLNDFEALAMALPELDDTELLSVGTAPRRFDRNKAVIGPGTGLGVASLVWLDPGWIAVGGEGGHVTLAAADDRESRVIAKVRNEFGHCSAERLISGPGLSLLHAGLHGGEPIDAAAISSLADDGDAAANETFEIFFRLLGTVAANLALTLGAFGGIYIGGGIVPRHADRFSASGFRTRFETKGRYGDYLESISTQLIVADQPTLTGLSAHAREIQVRSLPR